MEQLKKVVKRGLKTSIIILVYGLFIKNSAVYIAMFIGSLVSVLNFYMLYVDTTNIIFSTNMKKQAFVNYGRRYFLCLLTFLIMGHFGKLGYIVATAVGIFNIRFNIFILVLQNRILKKTNITKSKRGGNR